MVVFCFFLYCYFYFNVKLFPGREIVWDEICKVLWLKYKEYINCFFWTSMVSFFKSNKTHLLRVKKSKKASGIILFYDASLWVCQKKHIFALLGTYEMKFVLIFFWFANRDFYWANQMSNFKNFNQILTVFIFRLVFKGLLC